MIHRSQGNKMTLLILVRHAAATGQDPSCPLTEGGVEQAYEVAKFIKEFYKVDHIFSSPFERALKTAQPLAKMCVMDVKVDGRLRERVLYKDEVPSDWKSELEESFADFDYRCNGGETNGEGRERVISFLADVPRDATSVVVSHGNLCALLLGLFLPQFGCQELLNLTNPDIFVIDLDTRQVNRIWTNEGMPAIRLRPSARAILLDPTGEKVFLFHLNLPEARFPTQGQVKRLWVTPGGGIDEGEEAAAALRRELWEEMGLKDADYEIIGHRWSNKRATSWEGRAQYCLDDFYVVRLNRDFAMSFDNHTDLERRVVIGHKWWSLQELAQTAEYILPRQLKNFVLNSEHQWIDGDL